MKVIFALLASMLVISMAAASMMIPINENAISAPAPEKSPSIGDDWDLERVDFIHYAKTYAAGAPKTTSCYKLMGVKWGVLPVSYHINPANPSGLSEDFVTATFKASAETWDSSTSAELFNDAYTTDYSARYGVQDYMNSIQFGDYQDAGVIAVTSVWYTRIGKRIVEFDMLFNTRYVWGDSSINTSTVMDFQNIATHELGHAVGLADIYSLSCGSVTMYGYSDYGEMSKRSLESADVTGLQKMYGP